MTHIHWVTRQNKLEIPNDEEEVNTREIHKCDGQAHDPDTMVTPLTPKPTRKDKALAKTPPTIVSRREEDTELKKWPKARLCYANGIPETKTNDGSTTEKTPDPRTTPVCARRVILLVYSLSLHRHSYIGFILAFVSSIHNNKRGLPTQIPRRHPPHPNHTPIHHTSAIGKHSTQGR